MQARSYVSNLRLNNFIVKELYSVQDYAQNENFQLIPEYLYLAFTLCIELSAKRAIGQSKSMRTKTLAIDYLLERVLIYLGVSSVALHTCGTKWPCWLEKSPTGNEASPLWVRNSSWLLPKGSSARVQHLLLWSNHTKGSAAEAAGVQAIQLNDRYALSERNIQRIRELMQNWRRTHRSCSLGFFESLGTKYY